jgi:hypothetical protein
MEIPARDLIIGVIGAVIGAWIVSAGASGVRFLTESRKVRREKAEAQASHWRKADAATQSRITGQYIFAVLSHFLLANLFWLVPDLLEAFSRTGEMKGLINLGDQWMSWFWLLAFIFRFISLVFFFLGLGRIVRYTSLSRGASATPIL